MNPQLQQQGFVVYKAENTLRDCLMSLHKDSFRTFQKSWDDLPNDPYLLDGGSYRRRRYSVFNYKNKHLTALPNEPHYQPRFYNNVHGGINRHLETWHHSTIENPVLLEMINWITQKIGSSDEQAWRIQSHQFRISSSAKSAGKPTPEGVHKDGTDYVFIFLMQRRNIIGGLSELYDNNRSLLISVLLENSGDLLLLDDNAVYHGVTEINALDDSRSAVRDVLVLTFHAIGIDQQ